MLEPLCGLLAFGAQACTLGAAHLVHRLIQVTGDMEAVQHMQGWSELSGDNLQVGFPHVAAHKTQSLDDLWPQHLQSPPQRSLRTSTPHPQQAPAVRVDLVDDGQKVVGPQAAAPMNLVHPEGFDPAQLAMRQAPLDKPFHRAIDRFPTGLERPPCFPPTQPSRPACQKPHHGARHRTLAVAPRNVLDYHPVLDTLHPSWRVAKVGRDPPQWHKQPAPLRQAVIARGWPLTARTASPYPAMRRHRDLDRLRAALRATHTHRLVNESHKTLHLIQDGLNL